MRSRVWTSLGILAVVVMVASLVWVFTGQARSAVEKTRTAPRMAFGAPDLNGVWDYRTLTPLERPPELAGKEVLTEEEAATYLEGKLADLASRDERTPANIVGNYNRFWFDEGTTLVDTRRTSLIIDPPDGRLPPLTPEAQRIASSPEAKHRADIDRGRVDAASWEEMQPSDRCIQSRAAGPPLSALAYNQNMHLFQTPDYVAILNEQIHDTRIIPLDGRPNLPPQFRHWLGDARGRWEGDTLIVETANFREEREQVPQMYLTSNERMSLVERFTRVDADTLLYEYTVTDPGTWVRPWTAQLPMKKNPDNLYEYACHEGNYAMEIRLRGARAKEAAGGRSR